uniref:Uncharacterized protein n=1 Tax=Carcinus maenas virus 1 TaxID=2704945 RepID=A0A6G9HDB6_9VIRU|nr:hypothetical protein [Carcinus maenas virus 1]
MAAVVIVIDEDRLRQDLSTFEKEGFYITNCDDDDDVYHQWLKACRECYLTSYWFELESIKFKVQDMLYSSFDDDDHLINSSWHRFLKANEQLLIDLCL